MSGSEPATAPQGSSTVPFVADPDLNVYLGDALEVLRELPDASVQCCVTSPPFYALRDYGVEGQIGLEPTLDEWVAALVAVFAEVRRVMRPDGTLWLELADSYFSGPVSGSAGSWNGSSPLGSSRRLENYAGATQRVQRPNTKPKDLLGAPFEVAFALRANGWYWRQTIIWHKRQAMPESAADRPTTAHSYVFLMAPSARYYYDDEAIAEPAEWARWGDQSAGKYGDEGAMSKASMVKTLTREQIKQRFGGGRQRGAGKGGYKTTDERNERFQGSVEGMPLEELDALFPVEVPESSATRGGWHDHGNDLEAGNSKQRAADGRPAGSVRYDGWKEEVDAGGALTRRGRSLWSLASEPNRLAVCSICEAFWNGDHPEQHCGVDVVQHYAAFPRELARRAIAAGSREGDTVLDPFGGSGTTAMAARELGRKAVLIELRREYAVMIRERTRQWSLLGG